MRKSLAAIVAIAAGVLGFVYLGLADVAATSPHWPVTQWFLATAMERAVARRASAVETPSSLDEADGVRAGAVAFQAMCAPCHGAPGVDPDAVGRGLNPPPPDLADAAEEWSAAEVFWITQNGIRMTGMPAFGPTHSDAAIWEIVALVTQLPDLSPEQYRDLAGAPGHRPAPHRHDHR